MQGAAVDFRGAFLFSLDCPGGYFDVAERE